MLLFEGYRCRSIVLWWVFKAHCSVTGNGLVSRALCWDVSFLLRVKFLLEQKSFLANKPFFSVHWERNNAGSQAQYHGDFGMADFPSWWSLFRNWKKNTVNVTIWWSPGLCTSQKATSKSEVMPGKGAHLPLFRSLRLKHLLFSVGYGAIQSDGSFCIPSLCLLRQLFIKYRRFFCMCIWCPLIYLAGQKMFICKMNLCINHKEIHFWKSHLLFKKTAIVSRCSYNFFNELRINGVMSMMVFLF